jgi:phospholipid/cholesterol/gamma-HCH transport system substrate-binding protein
MTTIAARARLRLGILATLVAVVVSGCGFSPYELPLPGGADLGDNPYTIKAEFRDVLDLVPQSGVRVDDVSVGKVTEVELKGWHAVITMQINGNARLPDDAEAKIRQTSLLGEKFVSIETPENGGTGRLSNGDVIPLDRSGRNPELEEILSAAALLFNGGGLEKTNTIVRELNLALEGNETEVKDLLRNSETFVTVLDDNKQSILAALEKIDQLSVATLKQRKSITSALDDIPPALKIIDKQRDDLVKLLKSLDRLSDVATSVIRRSKADTLTDLRRLEPILRELANAGDDIANAFTLLTYPFPDSLFTGQPNSGGKGRALSSCAENPSPEEYLQNVRNGACFGDFINLDINLALNPQQAAQLLAGLLSIANPNLALPFGALENNKTAGEEQAAPEVPKLPNLLGGLNPQSQDSSTGDQPKVVCSLLRVCRTPAGSFGIAQQSDVGRLLVGPAVAS